MIRQVYGVKKDGQLAKISYLTQDKEKPTIEETSTSSIDQFIPNGNYTSKNIAEQKPSLAGGGVR